MNRTALIVAYYFPPLGMGGVQRMAKLTKYLPRFGYDVIVLTVKAIRYPAHDQSLLEELPASVLIYRSGSSDPARIGHFIPLPSRANVMIKTSKAPMSNRLWPDSKIGWKKSADKMLERICADHQIDVILSSSPPITGHLVAMDAASKYNIPWVADFRDLWESGLPEQVFGGGEPSQKAYRLLREIGAAADTVTRVNDSIGTDIFHEARTIMGGYDPDDFEFLTAGLAPREFSFCYLGTVGPMAPVEPFFHAARIQADTNAAFAESVRFRFIGVNDRRAISKTADRYGWKNQLEVLGYLPHREALREAAKSPIYLLSVPSEYPFITTGKVFDYLALPGTILAAAHPDGEAAKLIKKYDAGLCLDAEDMQGLGKSMGRLFEDHIAGREHFKADTSNLTRVQAAREFAAVFDRVVDG